jgi:hypothetical protein
MFITCSVASSHSVFPSSLILVMEMYKVRNVRLESKISIEVALWPYGKALNLALGTEQITPVLAVPLYVAAGTSLPSRCLETAVRATVC